MIKSIDIQDCVDLGWISTNEPKSTDIEFVSMEDYKYFALDYHPEPNIYIPYIYTIKPFIDADTLAHPYITDPSSFDQVWCQSTGRYECLQSISFVDVLDLLCENDNEKTYYMLKGKFDIKKSLLSVTHKKYNTFTKFKREIRTICDIKY